MGDYEGALGRLSAAGLDQLTEKSLPTRSLRIVAESYAIKGERILSNFYTSFVICKTIRICVYIILYIILFTCLLHIIPTECWSIHHSMMMELALVFSIK